MENCRKSKDSEFVPDINWELVVEGETWRLIEEGREPSSLKELHAVLSYC